MFYILAVFYSKYEPISDPQLTSYNRKSNVDIRNLYTSQSEFPINNNKKYLLNEKDIGNNTSEKGSISKIYKDIIQFKNKKKTI